MNELTLLQTVRLKGRVKPADLAATLREHETAVDAAVQGLTQSGLLAADTTVRLSSGGRVRLTELLADERRGLDSDAFARTYDEFRAVNRELKSLVSEWQLRNGEPNNHTDAEYDAAILARLDGVHGAVLPTLESAAGQLPRLKVYPTRLTAALERIHAGDKTWFTRPVVDSYHTVWFELHEELIGAAGLTREDEARSGGAG